MATTKISYASPFSQQISPDAVIKYTKGTLSEIPDQMAQCMETLNLMKSAPPQKGQLSFEDSLRILQVWNALILMNNTLSLSRELIGRMNEPDQTQLYEQVNVFSEEVQKIQQLYDRACLPPENPYLAPAPAQLEEGRWISTRLVPSPYGSSLFESDEDLLGRKNRRKQRSPNVGSERESPEDQFPPLHSISFTAPNKLNAEAPPRLTRSCLMPNLSGIVPADDSPGKASVTGSMTPPTPPPCSPSASQEMPKCITQGSAYLHDLSDTRSNAATEEMDNPELKDFAARNDAEGFLPDRLRPLLVLILHLTPPRSGQAGYPEMLHALRTSPCSLPQPGPLQLLLDKVHDHFCQLTLEGFDPFGDSERKNAFWADEFTCSPQKARAAERTLVEEIAYLLMNPSLAPERVGPLYSGLFALCKDPKERPGTEFFVDETELTEMPPEGQEGRIEYIRQLIEAFHETWQRE